MEITQTPPFPERSDKSVVSLIWRLERQFLVVPFLNLDMVGCVLSTRFAISLSDKPKWEIDSIKSFIEVFIPVNIHE